MEHTKLTNKIDVNELLDKVSSPEKVDQYEDDVLDFLSNFNINPGTNPVKTRLLYSHYKDWSSTPVASSAFSKRISNYLVFKDGYALIDTHAIKLTLTIQKIKAKTKHAPKANNRNHQHIQNFLKRFNITEGTYWIEDYILYSLYDSWTYQIKKEKPLVKKIFIGICNLLFEVKIENKQRFFQVDSNIKNCISDNMMKQLREGYSKYGSKREKRQTKKEDNKKV